MIQFPKLKNHYDHLIVHCAATPPSLDIDAAWVDRIHRQKGWSGNGYNVIITRSGEVQWTGTGHRTREIGKTGSHVGGCGPGWNKRSFGVCMAGGVAEDGKTPEDNFTEEQYSSLYGVILAAQEAFGIEDWNVIGHRDLIKQTNAAPKACPCFSVVAWFNNADIEEYENTPTQFTRKKFNWNRKKQPKVHARDPLKIPTTYTVKSGDTLWKISRTLGVRLADLRDLNSLTTTVIVPGQKLRLL